MKVKQRLIGLVVLISGASLIAACSVQTTPYLNSSRSSNPTVILAQAKQLDNNLPKKLYPCLPKRVRKLKLLAHTTANKNGYYLIGVYNLPSQPSSEIEPSPEYQETLVELDAIGCSVILPKEKMGAISLVEYVPEQVARELKLQSFRQAIAEAGGKEKFQKLLLEDENHEGNTSYFFPEDAWALQKLGIRLPSNVQIVKDFEQLPSN